MADEKLLIKVAYCYYQKEMTQAQIAQKLSMSRQRVNRLLKKSRELGIVEIRIRGERENFVDLEHRLEESFGLNQAVVFPAPEDELLDTRLSEAAADYLETRVRDGMTIGLSWGNTIGRATRLFPARPGFRGVKVVQLMGNLGHTYRAAQPDEITRVLAEKLEAEPLLLYAPLLVASEQAREAFLQEGSIARVMTALPTCDMALLSVSDASRAFSYFDSTSVEPELLEELRSLNPVGNICLRFFDHRGDILPAALHHRIIGVGLDVLQSIPNVVCVAGGELKRAALWGGLQGGLINTLITDSSTAQFLVDYKNS